MAGFVAEDVAGSTAPGSLRRDRSRARAPASRYPVTRRSLGTFRTTLTRDGTLSWRPVFSTCSDERTARWGSVIYHEGREWKRRELKFPSSILRRRTHGVGMLRNFDWLQLFPSPFSILKKTGKPRTFLLGDNLTLWNPLFIFFWGSMCIIISVVFGLSFQIITFPILIETLSATWYAVCPTFNYPFCS